MDCSRVSGDAVDRGPARKSAQLIVFGRWFGAGRIVATVELSGDRQASLSSGGTDEIQDLLIHSCSASTIKVKSRGLSPSGDSGRGLRYAPCR